MINTPQNRLISMTFWYPMLAELQHYTHNPITERIVMKEGKFTTIAVEDNGIRIRVPDTVFIHYPYGTELWKLADGKTPKGWNYFCAEIDRAARKFGYPVFLRTESSSDKHSWKDTCYLENKEQIESHIHNLVEHSLMADIPCDFFAVRRLIPTNPICTAFYGKMPIAKECRVFIKGGKVICHHPYWPEEAFTKHGDGLRDGVTVSQIQGLQSFDDAEVAEITRMAEYISNYIYGWWSVDFLKGADGNWWCIDMATGDTSYHWEGCEFAKLD